MLTPQEIRVRQRVDTIAFLASVSGMFFILTAVFPFDGYRGWAAVMFVLWIVTTWRTFTLLERAAKELCECKPGDAVSAHVDITPE